MKGHILSALGTLALLVFSLTIGAAESNGTLSGESPSPSSSMSNLVRHLWILDDSDCDCEKPPFEDTVTVVNQNGSNVTRIAKFNICQTVGSCRSIAVSLDKGDDSVWVVGGSRLWHYSKAGALQTSIQCDGATSVRVDHSDQSVWVACRNGSLHRYSSEEGKEIVNVTGFSRSDKFMALPGM